VKGSLFWFKDFKLKSLKGDLQLKNTSVQNTDNIFVLHYLTRLIFCLLYPF
jgi:hypothetical protein